MMSLVTPTQARVLIQTSVSDENLQELIEREEAQVIARYGAHYVDETTTVSETCLGEGTRSIYLCRRVAQVNQVVVDGSELSATDYRVWGGQGRIERLPNGATWGYDRTLTQMVQVTYIPYNDNAIRVGVMLDLLRLTLNRTAMKSESVGEYSYSAEDWEVARERILRRLSLDL